MLFELGFSMLVVSMNQPYYAKTDLTGKPEQTKVRKQIISFFQKYITSETSKMSYFAPHTVLVDCLVGLFIMIT